jgi:hypothetical protein
VDFEVFWLEYPRKVGKYKAHQVWNRLGIFEHMAIIKGLKLWKQTEQWHTDEGQWIPYASTFLMQRRWEDEPWTGAFEGK